MAYTTFSNLLRLFELDRHLRRLKSDKKGYIVRDFLPLTTLCFERNEPVSSTELHSLGTGPRRPPKVIV
uniref:Uncharacterized protein n=1 Tax=Glossina palpalis gambiensis TaxID=67801 RepID=A0A1B0BMX5_9MUSC